MNCPLCKDSLRVVVVRFDNKVVLGVGCVDCEYETPIERNEDVKGALNHVIAQLNQSYLR